MINYHQGISRWLGMVVAGLILLVGMGLAYSYTIKQKVGPLDNYASAPFTQPPSNNNQPADIINNSTVKNMSHLVTIKTNMGDISFTTYDADAPNTVKNFISLANKGFYDGVIFHRVIPKFMIQGGDPQGTGMGGPGYMFDDELNPTTESYKIGYKKGMVAMANAGPNTNGSQFFILVADYPLDHNYTIFGKVVSGQDVADAISKVVTGQNDRPISAVVMEKVTVGDY
jgi:cyclophilin family peptidyl-prolyl cis-trans isomerase